MVILIEENTDSYLQQQKTPSVTSVLLVVDFRVKLLLKKI